jgi:formylglycine-generating enzyme required for sulfatase activity
MRKAVGEIKEQLSKGKLIAVVGAGVTIAASDNAPCASWKGLLRDGIEHCEHFGTPKLSTDQSRLCQKLLDSEDLDLYLSVAAIIESKLASPDGPEWSRWLESTVGSLEIHDQRIIDAVHSLRVPIITTNYDDLLDRAAHSTGLPFYTWRNSSQWVSSLSNESPPILHLHGHWREPGSVTLGIGSYYRLLQAEGVQTIERALGQFNTLLFIGFGKGLEDPNFRSLVNFFSGPGAGLHRHYWLVLDTDVAKIESKGSVFPLGYGPSHSFLADFLYDLSQPDDGTEWSSTGRDIVSIKPDLAAFREGPENTFPEMVMIPSGQFRMGASANDRAKRPEELPQHTVTFDYRFAVGKFPITFREWDSFAKATGAYRPRDQGWGKGKHPVIYVSWYDAQEYLEWLNNLDGVAGTYRLLTEAEWEYIARGGSSTSFWWGNRIHPSKANYDATHRNQTVPVDAYPPNPFGIFDVLGNTWEWTEDVYSPNYHYAPSDGSAHLKTDSSKRVVRGGCWYYDADFIRCAARLGVEPHVRFNSIGFRIARTIRHEIKDDSLLRFISVGSGLVLTLVPNGRRSRIIQAAWKANPTQVWRAKRQTDGYFSFESFLDSTVLSVENANMRNHGKVISSVWTGRPSQQWLPEPEGDGYLLIARHSKKVLDVMDISQEEGATIMQFSRHGNVNQRWRVRPVSSTGIVGPSSGSAVASIV